MRATSNGNHSEREKGSHTKVCTRKAARLNSSDVRRTSLARAVYSNDDGLRLSRSESSPARGGLVENGGLGSKVELAGAKQRDVHYGEPTDMSYNQQHPIGQDRPHPKRG